MLGYPLRRAAMYEMLHGGVRLNNIVMPAPPIEYTDSSKQRIPTQQEESNDLEVELTRYAEHMIPLNLPSNGRRENIIIRNQDVYERYKAQKQQKTIPKPSELSILPKTQAVTPERRWMPFQVLKPLYREDHLQLPVQYQARDPSLRLMHEIHGERYRGEQKLRQKSLWQQPDDPKEYFWYQQRGW